MNNIKIGIPDTERLREKQNMLWGRSGIPNLYSNALYVYLQMIFRTFSSVGRADGS